jgi:hypothetical protein
MISYGNCFNVIKHTCYLLQAEAVEHPAVIPVTGQNYTWLPEVQTAITSNPKRHIILVAQGEPLCGIVGLVNCISKEPGSEFVRLQFCYFNIFMPVKNTKCYSGFNGCIELEYQCNIFSMHVHMHCRLQ